MGAKRKNKPGRLCSLCQKALLHWMDETSPLDRELDMLANFCEAIDSAELGKDAIAALGASIRRNREQRIIIDYIFLGRELVTLEYLGLNEKDPVVQGELLRISVKHAS